MPVVRFRARIRVRARFGAIIMDGFRVPDFSLLPDTVFGRAQGRIAMRPLHQGRAGLYPARRLAFVYGTPYTIPAWPCVFPALLA